MVSKSTIFDRLKSRFRSGPVQASRGAERRATERGARVATGGTEGVRAGAEQRQTGGEQDSAVARRVDQARSSRKLSPQEEATMAVREGFRELSSMMRGMQGRVDDQGAQVARAVDQLGELPAISGQQLEMMRALVERLDQHGEQQQMVARSLGDLPDTLRDVREALNRATATDARTAETLDGFRRHMDRIQGSMEEMVDHSRSHGEASRKLAEGSQEGAQEIARAQTEANHRLVQQLQNAQEGGVRALRQAHTDQSTRLGKLVEDGTRTNRAILIMLGLVFLALLVVAGLLAGG